MLHHLHFGFGLEVQSYFPLNDFPVHRRRLLAVLKFTSFRQIAVGVRPHFKSFGRPQCGQLAS